MEDKEGCFPSGMVDRQKLSNFFIKKKEMVLLQAQIFIENTYITGSSHRLKHKHPNPEATI
jgi:hypothetical protein